MITFLLAISIASTQGFSQDFSTQVIYGEDNRLDLYQVQDEKLLALADSTVALISQARLQEQQDSWKFLTVAYSTDYGLCADEKFYDQYLAPRCTGFLVAPDMVATAGHCVKTFADCIGQKYVFGYAMHMEGDHPTQASKSEVYSCAKIVSQVYEPNGMDYALIQLDRPVPNHEPLKLNLTGQIKNGTPLFVIGHPAGLPTKVAGGANVRSSDAIAFKSNLDTYGGNSGSPVFNAQTMEVEGILVRGEWDYVTAPNGSCKISNVCSNDSCDGEDSTKVSALKDALEPVSPVYGRAW